MVKKSKLRMNTVGSAVRINPPTKLAIYLNEFTDLLKRAKKDLPDFDFKSLFSSLALGATALMLMNALNSKDKRLLPKGTLPKLKARRVKKMRTLTHLEKDSMQNLTWNATIIMAELFKRCGLTDKQAKNIISVSKQMADMETAQKED